MSHIKKYTHCFILLFSVCFFYSCSNDSAVEQRRQRAESAQGDILIGIVGEAGANFFLQGVEYAVEEVNEKGGVQGRKIKTVLRDDHGDPKEAKIIAKEFASNMDIVAVIGHRSNETAAAAAIVYEHAGILFLSHGAKAPSLTMHKTRYIFRNIPALDEFGIAMAKRAAKDENMRRVIVFHERNDEQKRLADIFKKRAVEEGLTIVATRSYFSGQKDFKDIIAQLKEYQSDDEEDAYDSAIICGKIPEAAQLVKQLQEMSLKMFKKNISIIGGDGMDSPELYVIAGKASEGVLVPTVFRSDYPDKKTQDFVKKFRKQNELPPDIWAAQGYDAIHLLAHAMKKNSARTPDQIAASLRYLTKWKGVTGSYSFFPQENTRQEEMPEGDIKGKEIYFKKMSKGHFVFLGQPKSYNEDLFNYLPGTSLRLPIQEPVTSLDPGFVRSSSDVELCEQLFLGLTGFDPETNKPVPELAESIPVGKVNHTVYTFRIRDGIKWTDGTSVTAHDIVWTILRNLHPDTASPNAEELFVIKNAEAFHRGELKDPSKLGIYVFDNKTITFILKHPTPSFPALVSLPAYRPLPRPVIEQYKEKWTEKEHIVTNGPYKLVSIQEREGVFLKKNDMYYQAEDVKIGAVRYFNTEQHSMGLALYKNDDLDVMGGGYLGVPLEDVARIKKGPLKDEYNQEKADAFLPCTYAYIFNTTQSPVDNPLVRKAFSAVISRQLLIDVAHAAIGEPASTCTPKTLFTTVSSEEQKTPPLLYSPDQARKWLLEAGYPEGEDFPSISLVTGDSVFDQKIAEAVKRLLKHYLNVDVRIEQVKGSKLEYRNKITSGKQPKAHMFMAEICADYPDPAAILNKFISTASFPPMDWHNDTFTQLIREAGTLVDPDQREKKYQEADNILTRDDAVVMPLYHNEPFFLLKPRVQGWKQASMGGQQLHKCSLKNN